MPRLGNRKSRKGCTKCKARKVKCDEALPSCGWCKDHSSHCEYPYHDDDLGSRTSNASHDLGLQVSTPASAATTDRPSPSAHTDPQRHSLELGLLQYYVYTVARTFPYIDQDRGLNLHANMIPQEGLRCPCLLNTMYSYALLHLHIESSIHGRLPRNASFFEGLGVQMTLVERGSPKSKSEQGEQSMSLLELHREYLDKALQEQRSAILNIDSSNADGVCLSSVLIAMMALVHSSQMSPAPRSSTNYTLPLEWFYLQRSFTACLNAARSILTMDSATNTLMHIAPHINPHTLIPATTGQFVTLLEWHSPTRPEIMDEAVEEAYGKTLAYIQMVFNHISEKEPWQALGRRIFAFASLVPDTFVALLEEGRPRALVMLAHILAMAQKLDRHWWIFRGVAHHHVRGISTLVPEEWQWAMVWPLRVLEQGVDTPV